MNGGKVLSDGVAGFRKTPVTAAGFPFWIAWIYFGAICGDRLTFLVGADDRSGRYMEVDAGSCARAVAEGSALAGGFSLSIASREGAPLCYHKSDGWNYLLEAARL